jgi:hypothetical protein
MTGHLCVIFVTMWWQEVEGSVWGANSGAACSNQTSEASEFIGLHL